MTTLYTKHQRNIDYEKGKKNHNEEKRYKHEFLIEEGIEQLEEKCFFNYWEMKSIQLPLSLKSIQKDCFNGCHNLTNITIPLKENQCIYGKHIFQIGKHFDKYLKLPNAIKMINGKKIEHSFSVVLPSFVTSIGEYCFEFCKELKEIVFPEQLKSIGKNCFYKCEGLKEIILPQFVSSIGNNCFYNCNNISKLILSENIMEMGSYCFYQCYSLKQIVLPSSLTMFDNTWFSQCYNLTLLQLPSSLISLPKNSFSFCKAIKELDLPNTLTSIDTTWFEGCMNLTRLSLPSSLTLLDESMLKNCYLVKELYLPQNIIHIEKKSLQGLNNMTKLNIPLNETRVIYGNKLFTNEECFDQVVYLPESIKYINEIKVEALTSFEIPSFVTSLSEECFLLNQSLVSLVIPSSIQSIGKRCFSHCISLKSIILSNSITDIGDECFFGCTSLESFKFPNSICQFSSNWFIGCNQLTQMILSTSMISLSHDSFIHCKNLKELIIPHEMELIQKECFIHLTQLTLISLPIHNNQQMYGNKLFRNDSLFEQCYFLPNSLVQINGKKVYQLTSLQLPSFVTQITPTTFDYCQCLKSLTLTDSLTSINTQVFMKYTHLTSLKLPKTIISLEPFAFSNCSSLQQIEISSSMKSLPEYCFANCTSLKEIIGIEYIETIGKGCFYRCPFESSFSMKTESHLLQYDLSSEQINIIQQWTQKRISEIVFDSDIDDWNPHSSVFNQRIINREHLLFLIEDDNHEKFGYYLSTEVKKYFYDYLETDEDSFVFNLQSNGRLQIPIKCEIRDTLKGGYKLFDSSHEWFLINLSDIVVYKYNKKELCYCQQRDCFDYHGIRNVLCGKTKHNKQQCEYFNLQRIVVFQLI